MPAAGRSLPSCSECGAEITAGGWPAKFGDVFCASCWASWRTKNDPDGDYTTWLKEDKLDAAIPAMPAIPRPYDSLARRGRVNELPANGARPAATFCIAYGGGGTGDGSSAGNVGKAKRRRRRCPCCEDAFDARQWGNYGASGGSSGSTSSTSGSTSGKSSGGENSWGSSSNWEACDTTQVNALDEEEVKELQSMSYSDSHCHLDYCILNEKFGDEIWTFKKWLCNEWKEGWCPYGADCDYAHGEEDLFRRGPLAPEDLRGFVSRRALGQEDGEDPVDEPRSPSRDRGAQGICYTCSEELGSRRIVVNGVEFCSIEHMRAARSPNPEAEQPSSPTSATPSSPSRRPKRSEQRRGPKLEYLIHNCCEEEAIDDARTLAVAGELVLGGGVFCTFGCHPHNYEEYCDDMEMRLLKALKECGNKAVGWGECGLDYFKNFYDVKIPAKRSLMVEVFARQAKVSAKYDLPLVVHTRDAEDDTMKVLKGELPKDHHVHIHAFQGSVKFALEVLELFPNSWIGISGVIAFKFPTPSVVELVKNVPLDRLLLETDAPFLSEEPDEVPRIALAVAKYKGLRAAEVLAATHKNCQRMYKLEERIAAAQ